MEFFWAAMAVCLAIIAAAIYMVVSFALDLRKSIPALKEYSEHLFGESGRNAGSAWTRAKWFAIGAAALFANLSLSFFFLPLYMRVMPILAQAAVVIVVTKRHPETKSMKRRWCALGAAAALLLFLLLAVLEIGGSGDRKAIVQDFLALPAIAAAATFADRKLRVLENGTETLRTTGTITNVTKSSQRILFVKFAERIIYEYEFSAAGTTYKGIDSEPGRRAKKRGSEISSPANVVYKWDEPSKSMLADVRHGKRLPALAVIFLASALIGLHCVHFTDFVQTARNFRDKAQQAFQSF